jgi:predicted phage terminase large subunit-like protein
MPRSSLFTVPAQDADAIMQEVLVRAEAKKRGSNREFDPVLGESWQEAEANLKSMQTDINKYGEYVFGYKPAPHHRFWNKVADDVVNRRIPQNKVLFIAPPSSAKSTWNSIIRPVFHLGQHPDQSIIFMTSSDPMAQTFGSTVREALMRNARHKEVFPDPLTRPNRNRGWSGDGLYLNGSPPGSKDPAYKASGFGSSVMGARTHGLILDDPMDQKQAVSEVEQRRSKAYFDQTLVPRVQPNVGWIIGAMTRFHENDFASHLIRLAESSGDWLVFRLPMISEGEGDPMGRPEGELLWPERMTAEYVEAERKRMTIAEFNLVYQGDPTGIGGDVFKEEGWFQPLPSNFWSDIYPKCRTLMAWDLAFSERDRACYTVGGTAAIDSQMNMYLLHVVRKRMSLIALEDLMVELIRISKPLIVGLEQSRFHQKATRALAQQVLGRVMCNMQLVLPDSDKTARAMLPAGRAEAGKLFVNHNAPWYRSFVAECLGFPLTTYKDQVDMLSLLALLAQGIGEIPARTHVTQVEHVMA